jgi:hypothetical protein
MAFVFSYGFDLGATMIYQKSFSGELRDDEEVFGKGGFL